MEVYATGFEVAASLQTVEGVIRPLAEKKGIRLETCLPALDTAIYADEGKFRQVLYNLLSNAVKFTPAGGLVQTTAVMEDGVLRVVVADTGVGIAAEDQERIFDAFQQLDSTAARRHEGTGLGLALVRRLVELQGGHIWVESTLDEGSQFGFTVPARVEGITTAPADETTDRDLQPILESEPRRASVRTTGEVVVLQAQES